MRERPAAVVLAAGRGSRMPEANKLLAPIDGQPVVVRVVREILRAGLTQVVVVTGFAADAVRAALADEPVRCVHNPDYASGMASSLRTGLCALEPEPSGVLVSLGDMPLVRAEHIAALLDAFARHAGLSVCAPSFHGQRGNPVLWPAVHLAQLAALHGDSGGRALLEQLGAQVQLVPIDDPAVTLDVDTKEALEALRRRAPTD